MYSRRAVRGLVLFVACAAALLPAMAGAEQAVLDKKNPSNPDDIIYGGRGVTGKSVVGGVCSLIIPGLGQLINEDKTPKCAVHFVLGVPAWFFLSHGVAPVGFLFTLWRIWSGWDAFIDRPGGYGGGLLMDPAEGPILDASLGPAVGVADTAAC
jgi:hypothetical protein